MNYYIATALPILILLIPFVVMVRNGFNRNVLILSTIIGIISCISSVYRRNSLDFALMDGILSFLLLYVLMNAISTVWRKFKIPKLQIESISLLKKLLIITIFTTVLFSGTTIYYYSLYSNSNSDWNDKVDKLNMQLTEKSKTIRTLKSENDNLWKKNLSKGIALDYYFNYACIVTEAGNKYHRYGCGHIENRTFWIYNIDLAEQKGYSPCLDCWTDSYLSKYTIE